MIQHQQQQRKIQHEKAEEKSRRQIRLFRPCCIAVNIVKMFLTGEWTVQYLRLTEKLSTHPVCNICSDNYSGELLYAAPVECVRHLRSSISTIKFRRVLVKSIHLKHLIFRCIFLPKKIDIFVFFYTESKT